MYVLRELAQKAANTHYSVVTSPVEDICDGSGEIYQTSKKLLIATIKAAYPNLDASRIYGVWADCLESIRYCVEYVITHTESDLYTS